MAIEKVTAYKAADGSMHSTLEAAALSTADTMRRGARLELSMIAAQLRSMDGGWTDFLIDKSEDISRAARYAYVTADDLMNGSF